MSKFKKLSRIHTPKPHFHLYKFHKARSFQVLMLYCTNGPAPALCLTTSQASIHVPFSRMQTIETIWNMQRCCSVVEYIYVTPSFNEETECITTCMSRSNFIHIETL